jgi:putative ABC transport system permease protein
MPLWEWLFRRRPHEEDLDEEVQSHLRMAAQERMERGESAENARASALRQFGNVALVKETTRDVWGWGRLETLLQDLRYGLRQLRCTPGFTAAAILTLALGMGATSAIFTVTNSVVLRPLPYPHPERLFLIQSWLPGRDFGPLSAAEYVEYQKQTQTFAHLAAFSAGLGSRLTGPSDPLVVRRCEVTPSFWPTMGIAPELGRTFAEPVGGSVSRRTVPLEAASTAVISDRLWRSHFGANPSLVGKTIFLDEAPFAIVGVMPTGFGFPREPDVWTAADLRVLSVANVASFGVIGRLRPDISLEQAQAEVHVFKRQFQAAHPDSDPKEVLRLFSLHKYIVGDVRGALLLLLGAAGFVLLVGCANVANLLLARGLARRQEIAVRASLGAGRARLFRQLLTESLLLSLLGGAVGLMLGKWLLRIFLWLVPGQELPRLHEIHIDTWVLAFAFAASLLTGLLFGIVPALHLSDAKLTESLRRAGNRWVSDGGQQLKNAVVISEMALALVLLIGAGLMLKSLVRLRSVNPGFNPRDLFTMTVVLPQHRTVAQLKAFAQQTLENLAGLPGAASVAAVNWLPFGHADVSSSFVAEGYVNPSGEPLIALRVATSPGYFRTMGIRLLRGREFTPGDNEKAPRVVMVGETLAKRMWPGEDALGKRVAFDWGPGPEDWYAVVGVVADTKQRWLGEPAQLTVYQPFPQVDKPLWLSQMVFIARSQGNPDLIFRLMKDRLHEVDKDQPPYALETMESLVGDSMAQAKYESTMLAAFALIAVLIAAVGIYGVVAFSVSQRTHEIGVRIALGAQRRDVLQMILRRSGVLAALGVGLGVGGGFALTRVLQTFLFEVKTTDAATFAMASLLLIGVAMFSSYIPARRATKVDPMVALRYE